MKVYKKVGRRYKEMGREFTGFPSDGIWLVRDGRQSCILKLGDIGKVSVNALPYLELAERYFDERHDPRKSYSQVTLAREIALYMAEHADKKE